MPFTFLEYGMWLRVIGVLEQLRPYNGSDSLVRKNWYYVSDWYKSKTNHWYLQAVDSFFPSVLDFSGMITIVTIHLTHHLRGNGASCVWGIRWFRHSDESDLHRSLQYVHMCRTVHSCCRGRFKRSCAKLKINIWGHHDPIAVVRGFEIACKMHLNWMLYMYLRLGYFLSSKCKVDHQLQINDDWLGNLGIWTKLLTVSF